MRARVPCGAGFVFVVQPEVFVVHHRTPSLGVSTYGHEPEAWMIGETCWPDFENRIRLKYNYREGWCVQSGIGNAVNTSVINGSLMCVSQMERLCVLNCRPTTMRWQGKRVMALRRRAAIALSGNGRLNGRNRSHDGDDELYSTHADAETVALPSVRLPGTSARPPKAASAFSYPLAKREADRQECCRIAPRASKCEVPGTLLDAASPPPPPNAEADNPLARRAR